MSWFTSIFSNFKFPPPADSVRPKERQLLEEPVTSPKPLETAPVNTSIQSFSSVDYAKKQEEGRRRNKLITAAGLAFLGFSVLITRRSLARRRLAARAAFYNDAPAHNAEQSRKVSGALEAVEALNIATVNVLSLAMIGVGGTLWYLDINDLSDARKMIRGGLGVDGTGKSEEEANEEIEEVIASILARKDAKDHKK